MCFRRNNIPGIATCPVKVILDLQIFFVDILSFGFIRVFFYRSVGGRCHVNYSSN